MGIFGCLGLLCEVGEKLWTGDGRCVDWAG